MRGLRRFCVGMTALMFAWTGQTAFGQSPPAASGQPGGLNWPPPGLQAPQPFAHPQEPTSRWPAPMVSAPHGGMPPGGIQQTQFQQPMGPPPGPGFVPPPPYGVAPPPHAGPPQYPGGADLQPYPGLDMYRYGYQQTINENGLWFSEKLNASRKYHVSLEFMVPVYAKPGDELFGYRGINTGIGPTQGIPPFQVSIPRTAGDVTTGTGGTGGNQQQNEYLQQLQIQNSYFAPLSFDRMFNKNSGLGLKGEIGFENENGSGISINSWWGGNAEETYQVGQEPFRNYSPTLDPFDLIGNDPLYLTHLNARNPSLTINAGAGVAERIPFDTLFQMKFSQQAWGAGMRILRPAVSRGDWYTVRPVLGLRYIDLREAMAFRGLDSGAEYEFINFTNTDIQAELDSIFDIEINGGTDFEAGIDGRPDLDSFNDDDVVDNGSNVYPLDLFPTNPYETQIHASNHAHAAGPEFGFQTDLGGGKNFKIKLLTTVGLTATTENMRLSGFGVYNHFVNRVDPDGNPDTPDGGQIGTGAGGLTDAETFFSDRNTSTNISPLLDLSVSAEFRIFEYIPLIRKLQFMEDAKFRTSYGFLYVGNVARPHESIRYDSFPINPSLNPTRKGWTMEQWTFGVDWNY